MHLEVKSTTDPTRLTVHLTRHEYEVMRTDMQWSMIAVLVGAERDALSVATVCREWLSSVVPSDQSVNARWEPARLVVPPAVLMPGICLSHAGAFMSASVMPKRSVWGMRAEALGTSVDRSASAMLRPTASATGGGNAFPTCL